MQISKKSSQADFYGPRGFFVEHIELDLCVKFQVIQTNAVRDLRCQTYGEIIINRHNFRRVLCLWG